MKAVAPQSCGRKLDLSESAIGELSASNPSSPIEGLRDQLERSGYLLFRKFIDQEGVSAARLAILGSLTSAGALDPESPLDDGVVKDGYTSDFRSEDDEFPEVKWLVRSETTKGFFDSFLGGESRALDHIWLRMKTHGRATAPHCDIVYMDRGTKQLYTIWIPLGDIPLEMGPLMILEGSHRSKTLSEKYSSIAFNERSKTFNWHFRHGGFFRGGQYTKNPVAAQRELGGRWLTTDFKKGDLIVFSTHTLHGSLDNQSNRIRLSADARYQLASEPADPRWVKAPGA